MSGVDMITNAAKNMGMAGGRSRSRRRSYRGGNDNENKPVDALQKMQMMFKGGRGRSQRRQRTQRRGQRGGQDYYRSRSRGRSQRRCRSVRRGRSVRRA